MAEETKTQEAEKTEGGKIFKTIFKVLLGIALLIVGLVLVVAWKGELLVLIKGGLGLFLILAGAITLAIAKE